jgi:leucyl-tRNA synthetase
LTVPAGTDEAGLKAAALADEQVKKHIAGKQIRKVIVVPGKLVNIVVA